MACDEVTLEGLTVPPDWLGRTLGSLDERWTRRTHHRPGASGGTWACEIYHGCSSCQEHLSLPCSLLTEANEIGALLGAGCFSNDPATFLRLYLILLSEFADQYGDRWPEAEARLRSEPLVDPCGNTYAVRVIDTKWLERNQGNRLSPEANGPGKALVLVPPMVNFLDETTDYFRTFVDGCLKVPDKIRQFESSHYMRCG
jgi:hypothetical protein